MVTFASGATSGSGTVVQTMPHPAGGLLVLVDSTPFHPVDHTWPDQPGDTGLLDDHDVINTTIAASSPTGDLLVAGDIPAKRGDPDWSWHVAHQLADLSADVEVGRAVSLKVDDERRQALSAAHTACHLSALAMNAASAQLWRKDVRSDGLGHPDLDQLAMHSSAIDEAGSTDIYRLGKSLRKRGFDSAGFADQIQGVVALVQRQLEAWISSASPVVIADEGDRRVTARRHWTCALPEGLATIPCGGTHVASLEVFSSIQVDYQLDPEGTGLTVRTTPVVAP